MKRILTRRRLREYAEKYPSAQSSLAHWEKTTLAAEWENPPGQKLDKRHISFKYRMVGSICQVNAVAGSGGEGKRICNRR